MQQTHEYWSVNWHFNGTLTIGRCIFPLKKRWLFASEAAQELKELPDLRRTSLCKQPGRPGGGDVTNVARRTVECWTVAIHGVFVGPRKMVYNLKPWCWKHLVLNPRSCKTWAVRSVRQWQKLNGVGLFDVDLSRATDCIHRLRQSKSRFSNSNNRIWFTWKLGLFNAMHIPAVKLAPFLNPTRNVWPPFACWTLGWKEKMHHFLDLRNQLKAIRYL